MNNSVLTFLRRILAFAAAAIFLMPASIAQETSVRFAFLTDSHYSQGSSSVGDLRRCVEDVNSLEDLDFVICGGDLTDFGSDEEIVSVKGMLDSLKLKYYVVAGNHDSKWSESGCDTFKKVFGYEEFEFSLNGWRFIGCNCGPDMRMAPALIPRESVVWLKSLKAGQKTVFINHYPQDSSVLNYFDVTRELKRIGTRLVIGGHWHQNTAMDYEGLPGVLGRSTLSNGLNSGYNVVTIRNDSVFVAERRLYGSSSVQLEPWFVKCLSAVKDTVTYDENGLPSGYPWMRYDVNDGAVKEVWKIREDGDIASGFARIGDRAWYATSSGAVRCVSIKNGKRIWSKSLPGKVFSTPAVEGKYVVLGCADGFIYSLNPKNGRLRWKQRAGKSVLGSPVIFKGKVFIGASDGTFRALDLRKGSVVWEYSGVDGFIECRPWVDENQVVFGAWNGSLYSLNTDNGSLQWTWKCSRPSRMFSPAAVWPVKSNGKLFIAVPDRRLYVLDSRTGKELKRFDDIARESVGLSEDGRFVYCKSMWHKLTAIDTKTLDIVWQAETGTGYDISPTMISEVAPTGVIMPSDKGNIVCVKDGRRVWAYKISIALVNPMTVWRDEKIGESFILASTMDGTVTLLKTN